MKHTNQAAKTNNVKNKSTTHWLLLFRIYTFDGLLFSLKQKLKKKTKFSKRWIFKSLEKIG